jgi:hypothetical protein
MDPEAEFSGVTAEQIISRVVSDVVPPQERTH